MLKLIQTKKYLLLVNEKAEYLPCSPTNICLAHKSELCDKCGKYQGLLPVAYYPLAEESERLSLPLLPCPFGREVSKGLLSGRKVVEYAKKYEGTDKYDAVVLAIEFGYNLAIDEAEEEGLDEKTMGSSLPRCFLPDSMGERTVVGHNGRYNEFGTIAYKITTDPSGREYLPGSYIY